MAGPFPTRSSLSATRGEASRRPVIHHTCGEGRRMHRGPHRREKKLTWIRLARGGRWVASWWRGLGRGVVRAKTRRREEVGFTRRRGGAEEDFSPPFQGGSSGRSCPRHDLNSAGRCSPDDGWVASGCYGFRCARRDVPRARHPPPTPPWKGGESSGGGAPRFFTCASAPPRLRANPFFFFFAASRLRVNPALLRRLARTRRAYRATPPSISAAVALALPTTPGMPAPGWVPAPTK